MNMSWPEPDDVHYCDVLPCYMRVMGQVFGSDIQNVTVTHGNNTWECGYDNGKYFLVAVRKDLRSFILTCYISDIIKKGETLWEKR